ncbi:putative ABC transporter ATP-binding protein [Streptomyces aurantiacus JA 4570]|uniref:Putative ABC transporter ATP-binding protein n=1 Tax=Streptomyces aurantiacus JA 4570 TaxID=1286094 RepID=S3Z8B3_9ACTN|nr:putative ABC transporter ATP-binding protein [Streptomyces aurantiacus JA 4570]
MTTTTSFAARATGVAARATELSKVYGQGETQVVALDRVSVDFGQGEFTAIMGPSGSGKSTLMHCVAGLDSFSSGSVRIGETELSTLKDKQLTKLRRDKIGFIFQAFNLLPTLTALENITLPMDIAGRKPDKQWLEQVISMVGLAGRLSHRPTELSGGQQQRVAVAPSSPAASSSAWPWPVRSPPSPRSSSVTSRREIWTRVPGPRFSASSAILCGSSARPS